MSECVYEVKSPTGQILRVYEDKLELTQKGVMGALTQGLAGSKIMYYSDITSIQFKNCGWTNGFFEFSFGGGVDRKGGAWSGMLNDNRFTFGKPTIGKAKELAKEMEKVNEYIQECLRLSKTAPVQQAQSISSADEIKKYKGLLDDGIITQEEFEAKKKQLLGL